MKTRKEPHPVTGSWWINEQAEARCGAYISKFKEKHGDTSDPTSEDFDVEVAVLAGQGKKGGRLWIGDGLVDPKTIPSLRSIRRGRAASGRDPPTGFGSSCRAVTGMFSLAPLRFFTCFPLQC